MNVHKQARASVLFYRGINKFFLSLLLVFPATVFPEVFSGGGVKLDDFGSGFDSDLGKLRSPCISGTIIEQGSSSSELDYTGSMTFEDKVNETFGKVSGGVNLVLFSGSVSTSLTSRITETEQSAVHGITFRYFAKDLTLEDRYLSPLGHSMSNASDSVLDSTCGDSFIYHMKLGSELHVVTKLHFRTKEDFQKWVTKVKIRVLFVKKTKTYTKEWYELTKNAVFSVDVVANGGLTEHLNTLLNSRPRYCKTDNLQPCLDTANEIFEYLFNGGGYENDLQNTDMNVLSFSAESYLASGHVSLVTDIDDSSISKGFAFENDRLGIWYQENQEHSELIKAFKAVEESEEKLDFYKRQLEKIEGNLGWLDWASQSCSSTDDLNQCQIDVNTAISNQQSLDFQ